MSMRSFNQKSHTQKQALRTLCRFLALRHSYYCFLILLCSTGLILTLTGRTQFAPYSISLVCLLLPNFLSDPLNSREKKENRESPLPLLYKRYHYSPSAFASYRITLLLGMILLFAWHILQTPVLRLFGLSLPLLYLAFFLFLYAVLGRVYIFIFHQKLMNGNL